MISTLGLETLKQTPLQNPNLWMLSFFKDPTIRFDPKVESLTVGSTIGNVLGMVGETTMHFFLQTATLPQINLNLETSPTGAKYYKSRDAFGDLQLTYLENEFFSIYRYFKAWQREVYNFKDDFFYDGNHYRHGMLTFFPQSIPLAQSGSTGDTSTAKAVLDNVVDMVPNKIFLLEGMQFKGIADYELNYTATDSLKTTATLTVDTIRDII